MRPVCAVPCDTGHSTHKLYMCNCWAIKGLISLMHGITMKIKVRNFKGFITCRELLAALEGGYFVELVV